MKNFDVLWAEHAQLQVLLPVEAGNVNWLVFLEFSVVFDPANDQLSFLLEQGLSVVQQLSRLNVLVLPTDRAQVVRFAYGKAVVVVLLIVLMTSSALRTVAFAAFGDCFFLAFEDPLFVE